MTAKNGADALNWAITAGNQNTFKILISQKIKLGMKTTEEGYNSFMHAAESGNFEIIKEFVMALDKEYELKLIKWDKCNKNENALVKALKCGWVYINFTLIYTI